ncbi:MAG: Glu/Leu/Phe/Val dehydrogenase [Nitrospinae bacterium]|nr:Glu/Leu/Phe/Val dehydrogenase [Nitrospinota bacterium]
MTPLKLPGAFDLEILPDAKSPSERFSSSDENTPEQKIRLSDPETGQTWGFVVIDNTVRGPGLGGIRMAPDLTLLEVSRLARAMTLKNSAACLPLGGGKSGLTVDPYFFQSHPHLKRKLISLFTDALFKIDSYIPAPDMGTNEIDIQQIYEKFSEKLGTFNHMRGGAGRPPEKGGIPIDDWGLTAHGLFAAARTMETLQGGFPIKSARVVIQGYGNVGSWTATKLQRAGAVIVGASDIHVALWNPTGLNVEELNRIRKDSLGLQRYSGPVEKRFGPDKLDWLLEAPCEILVPAARPDCINAKNADRIDCKMILQGANTPSNKMTEYYLQNQRKILSLSDFIVNVGGVIGCAVELKMTGDLDFKDKMLKKGPQIYLEELIANTVSKNVTEVHNRMTAQKQKDVIFRNEALNLAQERLRSPTKEDWL